MVTIVILVVGAAAGVSISRGFSDETTTDNGKNISNAPQATVESKSRVYSLPQRLVIPKLNIDAAILPMGIMPSGEMDSPKTNTDSGWYSSGTRPGNVGSAVIAGHLGLKNDAVFGKLHMLAQGDKISVVDDQEATVSFKVREVREYAKDSDTTEIFNSPDGVHLNLITCNGDWNSSQATYEKRLVVFTDKI